MMISIKFLGTGIVMGVPIWNCECDICKSTDKRDKRYRSSLLVKINNKNYVKKYGNIDVAYDGMEIELHK